MSPFVILLMIALAMGAPQEEPGKRAAPGINTSQGQLQSVIYVAYIFASLP